MANGITWMFSEKGGNYPCCDAQEVAHFKKVGWVECGDPPWDKETKKEEVPIANTAWDKSIENAKIAINDTAPPETSNDLTKDELIELANSSGFNVDRRYSEQKLKDMLGI